MLDSYLRFFQGDTWRLVNAGGMVSRPDPGIPDANLDLAWLLEITSNLLMLEACPGFSTLLEGLRNPPQITSTLFEIRVASWCKSRDVTEEVVLSPSVSINNSTKHPDLLWRTTLGPLYCECKRANTWEAKLGARFTHLADHALARYTACGNWDPSLRVDLTIEGRTRNGIENRISEALGLVHAATKSQPSSVGQVFFVGDVMAVAAPMSEASILQPEGSYRRYFCRVPPDPNVPRPVWPPTTAYLAVAMPVARHLEQALAQLLRDARTQLPRDTTGAVFVHIGHPDLVFRKAQELLAQPFHPHMPWLSLWSDAGLVHTVRRSGQPFDARLVAGPGRTILDGDTGPGGLIVRPPR